MHRPALIGPSSVTGLGNQRDWLSLLIRASFDLGVVPLEHEQDYKMLYLVPVDYVARGVLMTSLGVHRGKVWCVCVCVVCVCASGYVYCVNNAVNIVVWNECVVYITWYV